MHETTFLPSIIQGGMGVGVSNWSLARAVSQAGQLGVVSGTALPTVLARRLQLGDPSGLMREALSAFPITEIAHKVIERYFNPRGKPSGDSFSSNPLPNLAHRFASELTIAANFVEVHLAKRGHDGFVGLNLLEKVQIPTLPSLFGAMLAGVDYILMGAGIPRSIPRVLDQFAIREPAQLKIDVQGALPDEPFYATLDPAKYDIPEAPLKRPAFLAVVSSDILAKTLAKRSEGEINGFVIEGVEAGGHNAPPRGPLNLDTNGEPLYGPRDTPNLEQIRQLGLPFWLAGSFGRPGKLAEAKELGAVGIQVGTAFAYCEESGIAPEIKARVLDKSRRGAIEVFTDPLASPTGFPFKVLQMEGSVSEPEVYAVRNRVCDLGYLRSAYRREDGSLGYRCPGEPVKDYVAKGGTLEETKGRKCVCNGLLSTIGLPQIHKSKTEPALLTTGRDADRIHTFVPAGKSTYSAAELIQTLLAPYPERKKAQCS
ncbi:nitronate monooxygenase [Pelagicoccus sp. SDUM812005]|uniref:nitronate monooxygenase n=1 Tax=Pelagicoccus sp. SDUM812005 TaxID=3041257 RepID=UPI00280DC03B|nr:nitronate monooxygenase [Pelagicoccus sp. SDUM812005]MDQ8182279.1 nitronate monooxygenase [Pelagicoccus sp. SDUM812005]